MTWREIREVLNQMPEHLLDDEATVWRYEKCSTNIIPIHDMLSPLYDSEDANDIEWKEGGCYGISLQSFGD